MNHLRSSLLMLPCLLMLPFAAWAQKSFTAKAHHKGMEKAWVQFWNATLAADSAKVFKYLDQSFSQRVDRAELMQELRKLAAKNLEDSLVWRQELSLPGKMQIFGTQYRAIAEVQLIQVSPRADKPLVDSARLLLFSSNKGRDWTLVLLNGAKGVEMMEEQIQAWRAEGFLVPMD